MSNNLPTVLIVHNRYRVRGGEERIVEEQIEQFRSRGHRVETYFEDSRDFESESRASKVIRGIQTIFSIRHYRKLREKIRATRPAIIHAHNIFPLLTPSIYYAARRERVPLVQSVHNYRFLCSNGLFLLPSGERCERCVSGTHLNAVRFGCYGGNRLRSAGMALTLSYHRWRQTFLKKIDAFIAPSEFLREKLIQGGFAAEKIHRISAGISAMSPRTQEPNERTVLFIGRLSREKGIGTLLKAAKMLPDWAFQFAGSGPMQAEVEATITKDSLTNVKLLGLLPRTEIEALLQKTTALVVPSECYENLPTVILEAWFYGTPVIASRLGGMKEMIQEGKTGTLFDAGDPSALIERIRALDSDKNAFKRAEIEKHFRENFSLDANYLRVMDVYRKVLLS